MLPRDFDIIVPTNVQTTQTDISVQDGESQTNTTIIDLAGPFPLSHLHAEQLDQLSFHIGKTISSEVKTDSMILSNEKTMESLVSLNPAEYLSQRNKTLVGFLSGISKLPLNQATEHRKFLLCKTVESVMNLSACYLLLPFHFRESVLLYSITGSRLGLSMLGSSGPHSSYQRLKLFLNNLAIEDNPEKDGDIVLVFDNNQVLHRQWNVNIEGKFLCHIVTMVAVLKINPEGSLQNNVLFKPGTWMLENTEKVAGVKYIDQIPHVKKTHYEHLYPYLTEIIDVVVKEQHVTSLSNQPITFRDTIDVKVDQN